MPREAHRGGFASSAGGKGLVVMYGGGWVRVQSAYSGQVFATAVKRGKRGAGGGGLGGLGLLYGGPSRRSTVGRGLNRACRACGVVAGVTRTSPRVPTTAASARGASSRWTITAHG